VNEEEEKVILLSDQNGNPCVVQIVRQVNYCALESKRYLVVGTGKHESFVEVTEGDLVNADFGKLNS
jgi:hypothetical protein